MAGEKAETWTHDMEMRLFLAMRWNQPVGVNRHFHMLLLQERLSSAAGKWIGYRQIWDHLANLFDLEALEDIEKTRYEDEDSELCLPKDYFEYDSDRLER